MLSAIALKFIHIYIYSTINSKITEGLENWEKTA